jgi:ligand-binding sensor domain-containing protein
MLAIAVTAGAGAAHALEPDRALSQYLRRFWGADRGFPGGSVHAFAQTADGYLWIGTDKGLVRFDGSTFRLVTGTGPGSPPIVQVLGLIVDAEGSLWVRLPGANVVRYREGTFENALSRLESHEDAITAMAEGRDEGLLLAGLVNGPVRHRRGSVETLARNPALPPRSPVIAMAETADGRVWMGTRDAGLYYLEGGRVISVAKGLPDRKINCLLATGGRDLWIGTDQGVVRWDGEALTTVGLPASLGRIQVLAMTRDRASNLWIGTNAGLVRASAVGAAWLEAREPGPRTAVTALFEDREGNLWTGGNRGIERLRDSTFTTYSRSEGLPSESPGPVHVDPQGRTWFAPSEGGLHWLKEARVTPVTESGLDTDVVYSIAGGRDGLWVGRRRGGLTHLRFSGSSWSVRTYTPTDGLPRDSIYAVHESRDGAVWAGTLASGVSVFRNGTFTGYTTANGLPSNTIASIVDTADGTTWLATPSGLVALAHGAVRVYTARDGLPSEDVNTLLEDRAGTLWIGTGDGLAFLQEGTFKRPSGVPLSWQEQVFGLAEDGAGWLWIATSKRVLRAKRDALLRGSLTGTEVSEYGLADGLQGVSGIKRHRSVVADPVGRIWLSMDRGLSVVDPDRMPGELAPAIPHILAVSADGSPMDLRGPLRVPAGRRRVTFTFSGVSLSIPERIRFRYTLDGFDRDWSDAGVTGEAVYTNLGPGSYRFRVTAGAGEGPWPGPEAALGLEVEPALWQAWWLRLSVALGSAIALFGLYRFRLGEVSRRLGVRFEERLAERTRIAQELHDTLLQGFLSASMQLHVAVDQLPPGSPEKPRLSHILDLMGRVIEEGRNAVRGLRSTYLDADDLEHAFSRLQQELGMDGGIRFNVLVAGPPRPLHPVIRDEVYRIGREALVNAFRHSGATTIEVELEYAADHLGLFVRDDGAGIDAEVLRSGREGHWGLSGMRERAQGIGARLRVASRAADVDHRVSP